MESLDVIEERLERLDVTEVQLEHAESWAMMQLRSFHPGLEAQRKTNRFEVTSCDSIPRCHLLHWSDAVTCCLSALERLNALFALRPSAWTIPSHSQLAPLLALDLQLASSEQLEVLLEDVSEQLDE